MMDTMRPYGKWILWGLGVLLVIVLIAFAIVSFLPKPTTQVTPAPAPTPTLPILGTVVPVNSGKNNSNSTTATTITLLGKLGPVVIKDFIHNGVTGADPQNKGLYFVAGSPGYCMPDGTCPGGASSTDFNVVYDSDLQFFTVTLLAEPIGQVRTATEQFMLQTLGVSQNDLCALHYYLGTIKGLNDAYADRNLGFSFCPGATVLPK